MSRRRRLTLAIMMEQGIEYSDFQRVKDATGRTGWRYRLDKRLTADQRTFLSSYGNVVISSAQHRHAPELVFDTVIVLD